MAEPTIIFKPSLLVTRSLRQPRMLIPLTLSVLLVGNYLTVARVGIIMISLDHGCIY